MSDFAFSARKVKGLRPLNDSVIVTDMNFEEQKTASGIIIRSDDGKTHGIKPRWAKVYAIGPEQKDIKIGEWILVEHGRWTRGIEVEDETGKHTLRRVDPNDILLQSDQPMQDETFSDAIHVEAKPSWMQHN